MFIIRLPVWENWKQVQVKQFDRQGSQEKRILLVHENNSTSHLGSLTKVKIIKLMMRHVESLFGSQNLRAL